MDLIQELRNAVINGDEEDAVRIAKDIIENKIDVQQAITDGIVAGMKIVGKKYEQREYFIPEIIISTDAFKAAFEIFKPHLTKTASEYKATVIIGVVKGDIHEIGKNIVAQFLSLSGYNIIDLGRNVHSDDFIKAVETNRAMWFVFQL